MDERMRLGGLRKGVSQGIDTERERRTIASHSEQLGETP